MSVLATRRQRSTRSRSRLGSSPAAASGAAARTDGILARHGLHHLPRRPLRCLVRGHVEAHHPTAVVGQHQEPEGHSEGGRRHDEEGDRHQVLDVVVQERAPGRRPRLQKRLKPSRCHRITVAGWTTARAYRHAPYRRDRTTHRARSQLPKRGRRSPRARASTPIWWRSARFSSASSRWVHSDDLPASRMTRIKLNIPRTLPTQVSGAQRISCG